MVRLNRTHYSLPNFTSKLFPNWVLRAKFQRITQIPRNSPTQSVNSMKFALFINLLYIMFQAPAPAENPAEFQRITQIPRNSPTKSANYAKFAPFVNISYVSNTCPGREPCGIPANYANSAQFAHIVRESHEIRQICYHYILCFGGLPQQRTLSNSSELCKFHAVHPHSP